jgi:hypothetical protein
VPTESLLNTTTSLALRTYNSGVNSTNHEEIFSNQVPYGVDICCERIAILIYLVPLMLGHVFIPLMLGHVFIPSCDWALESQTACRIIASGDSKVDKTILRSLRSSVVLCIALETPVFVLLHRMETVWIHIRRVHHNIVTVTVPVTMEMGQKLQQVRETSSPVCNVMIVHKTCPSGARRLQRPVRTQVDKRYLEELPEARDGFTKSVKARFIIWSEERHDHQRQVMVLWVLQNIEDGYAVVSRVTRECVGTQGSSYLNFKGMKIS